ncbi:MAG: transglutaminase domain-containing protein [Candidatus Shapirobacteria bacterium]|jgi:hypothetical protein
MFLLIIILALFFPSNVFASNEFDVIQNISYEVNLQGDAKVSHDISLTNRISQIYAKEYQIVIHNTNIQSVTGHDKHGNIVKSVVPELDKTTINLQFDQPTIGKDQQNNFFLEYTISKFAQKKGSTWELLFPQFENQIPTAKLNITLSIPGSFGDLSFASIPIQNNHLVDNRTIIEFSPSSSKSKPLLVFGNNQVFDFKLLYYLKNPDSAPKNMEIPIPPDTNLQTIIYKDFNPKPQSVRIDEDGNWLASFFVNPSLDVEITIEGQAKIHPSIKQPVSIDPSAYTTAQKYWEVDSPDISIISNTLNTPKSIYDYVVSTLTYDYDLINSASRKGGQTAILNPSKSLCTEFTDLFVTLARSAKIPAREIEGFAYSNNPKIKPTNLGADILHAWPEYYDSNTKTWIQVDPTWEKTTNGIDFFKELDLNHITFVIHGKSSENPAPPGAYKKDNLSKTVFVDFASDSLNPQLQSPVIEVENNQLVIRNPNLFALPPTQINLQNLSQEFSTKTLPPLGKETISIPKTSFINSLLSKNSNFKFEISTSDGKVVKTIINRDHYLNLAITAGVAIFILCIGGIILTTAPKKK